MEYPDSSLSSYISSAELGFLQLPKLRRLKNMGGFCRMFPKPAFTHCQIDPRHQLKRKHQKSNSGLGTQPRKGKSLTLFKIHNAPKTFHRCTEFKLIIGYHKQETCVQGDTVVGMLEGTFGVLGLSFQNRIFQCPGLTLIPHMNLLTCPSIQKNGGVFTKTDLVPMSLLEATTPIGLNLGFPGQP